jgi:hypothetical protein
MNLLGLATAFLLLPFVAFSQKFTAHLTNEQSRLFFDGELIGMGAEVQMDKEIPRNIYTGFHVIIVRTPGYLDAYYSLYGGKQSSYEDQYTFLNECPLIMRESSEKYVHFGTCTGALNSVGNAWFYKGKDIAEIEEKKTQEQGVPLNIKLDVSDEKTLSKNEQLFSKSISHGIVELLENEHFTDSSNQLLIYNFQNSLIVDVKITKYDEYFVTG